MYTFVDCCFNAVYSRNTSKSTFCCCTVGSRDDEESCRHEVMAAAEVALLSGSDVDFGIGSDTS